jgi:hypothetical protein
VFLFAQIKRYLVLKSACEPNTRLQKYAVV